VRRERGRARLRRVTRYLLVAASAFALFACDRSTPDGTHTHAPPAAASVDPLDAELDRVAAVHGAPGPWAVAGYRMGQYALGKLGLERGSFDLEVSHKSPREVMFSCIADGAAAATGASAGKLNLVMQEGAASELATTYRQKSTGRTVTLRPTGAFRNRFADTPREHARELGRRVLTLPADQVFEEVGAKESP
jgi:formylmethanofuran dehydrogenase subunit E